MLTEEFYLQDCNSPLISVILAMYNAEYTIKQCLSSLLAQTIKNFELICIDDSSTDQTVEIVKCFSKEDPRIILLECEHGGGGKARNFGLKKARGKYYFFPDADDFFEPNYLESHLKVCLAHNADLTICEFYTFDNLTQKDQYAHWGILKKFLPKRDCFSPSDIHRYIFNVFQNYAWNKMFKAKLIRENDIKFQEILRTNDLFFTARSLVQANKIALCHQSLVHYRVHNQYSCQATNNLAPYDFIYAFNALKEFLIQTNLYEIYKISFINHKLNGTVHNLFSINDKIIFIKLYNKIRLWISKDIAELKEKNIMRKEYYRICSDILNCSVDDFCIKHSLSL